MQDLTLYQLDTLNFFDKFRKKETYFSHQK
jgi:hypothetical protein